jgi:hypothetical protein
MASAAQAIPDLQLYIDGASYDSVDETWVTNENTFDLWVIAEPDVGDVLLSAAVSTEEANVGGSITLTPTTTTLVTDSSMPTSPTFNGVSADGAVPQLANGSDLPTHGIYGMAGTSFLEWDLGDMDLQDSPCGDFIDAFPTTLNKDCTIHVYSVTVTGFTEAHFDVYGEIEGGRGAIFAPFSHDAAALVPEPSAALLFGVGALIVGIHTRRRR